MQQYAEQQQQNQTQQQAADNKSQVPLARAVLVCRPNSHPFSSRTLSLEANKIVKIGRAIARTKATEANAIFDCKVLSRNHAELWYSEGKFFIKVRTILLLWNFPFRLTNVGYYFCRTLAVAMEHLSIISVLVKRATNLTHTKSVPGTSCNLVSMSWKTQERRHMGAS